MSFRETRACIEVLAIPILFPLPIVAAVWMVQAGVRWIIGPEYMEVSPWWQVWLAALAIVILHVSAFSVFEVIVERLYKSPVISLVLECVVGMLGMSLVLCPVVRPLWAAGASGAVGLACEGAVFGGLKPVWRYLEQQAARSE